MTIFKKPPKRPQKTRLHPIFQRVHLSQWFQLLLRAQRQKRSHRLRNTLHSHLPKRTQRSQPIDVRIKKIKEALSFFYEYIQNRVDTALRRGSIEQYRQKNARRQQHKKKNSQ